eukprot:1157580-Pelagomonas_calceolata.AAC.1
MQGHACELPNELTGLSSSAPLALTMGAAGSFCNELSAPSWGSALIPGMNHTRVNKVRCSSSPDLAVLAQRMRGARGEAPKQEGHRDCEKSPRELHMRRDNGQLHTLHNALGPKSALHAFLHMLKGYFALSACITLALVYRESALRMILCMHCARVH